MMGSMVGWLAWSGMALAQTASPSATEVLILDPSTPCPDVPSTHVPGVLNTTIGLATHQGDGTYAYGCPSAWDGVPGSDVELAPDGVEALLLSEGTLSRSLNGGCTSEPVVLPGEAEARDVIYWRQAFWVLTFEPATGTAAVYRLDEGVPTPILSWTDFAPDVLLGQGSTTLWVSGAAPSPQVRRISLAGGLSGDVALGGLPDDLTDLTEVVPVAATETEVWLRVTRRADVWTWHGLITSTEGVAEVQFTDSGERSRHVRGPVLFDGRWIAVRDLELIEAAVDAGAWIPTGQDAPWTCLHQQGGAVFACTVPAMLALTGFADDGTPETTEVFSMLQLGPPASTCGADAACEADWEQFGGLAGVLDAEEPAVCPDGRLAADLEAEACACGSATGGAMAWWIGALGVAWRRRRRGHDGVDG